MGHPRGLAGAVNGRTHAVTGLVATFVDFLTLGHNFVDIEVSCCHWFYLLS